MKLRLSLFFAVFFFLTFFASGYVDSQDGLQYLAVARRFYYDGTFEMPTESFDTGDNIHMSVQRASDGKVYSVTGLGYSLSLIPAVLLEHFFLIISENEPISAFPLEHDWPVLLFASMTNAAWGALLVVGMFQYFELLGVKRKQSLFIALILFASSNLFVYSKHTFAQMMFTAALFHTFLQLKLFSIYSEKKHLFYAGMWYGVVVISYNLTYTFVLIPLGLFYLLSTYKTFSISSFKEMLSQGAVGLLGLIPFLAIYRWFNYIRFGSEGSTSVASGISQSLSIPPAYVIVEGFWGLLLSPGKSIFLFSPVLLLLVLFWFKLQRKLLPEIVAAASLFLIYLWFIGTLLGGKDFLVWHGDSSWGPRYLLPTLPLLLVLVGYIYTQISKRARLFVFYPLIAAGMLVTTVGTVLPYQTRFAGLDVEGFINGRSFNVYEYGNEIPRYSPPFLQLKRTVKRLQALPRLHDRGEFNLSFKDGYEYPFDLGFTVWRGMREYSIVTFEQTTLIEQLSLKVKNHKLNPESSQSAVLLIQLNGESLFEEGNTLLPQKVKSIQLPLSALKKVNTLKMEYSFESSSANQLKQDQIIFLEEFSINNQPQNLSTINMPYVSAISTGLETKEYEYWGGSQKDPWDIWHHHSGVFERTFDFWWLRPIYYWDLPKVIYIKIAVFNAMMCISFSVLSYRTLNKK